MEMGQMVNGTTVTEFILLGFGIGPQERFLLLIFFTILYVVTLAENFTIIILVVLDNHLSHLPMYILLSNFSWLEICYVSTTVPRLIFDLTSPQGVISFTDCFLQFYLLFSFGTTEDLFLSAMALDRYLAICHPLRYPQIMSPDFCFALVIACWGLGFMAFIIPVTMISKLSFCGPNVIDHFLCDAGPILALACPPLGVTAFVSQMFLNAFILSNVLFVVLSYGTVILTLMKPSFEGSRRKAFSTISFHLIVVTLFYGSLAAIYICPEGDLFLSDMALDRYLAICHPLRYPQIMSHDFCFVLVISKLSFCGPNVIDHFLCDAETVLALACPPLGVTPFVCQMFVDIFVLSVVVFIALSYGTVIVTLMKPSFKGSRRKAFSTISFHLIVVTLFYGSIAAICICPEGENQAEVTKAVTLFYTSITPFLNPMIYCLRNDQVKDALGRLRRRKLSLLRRNLTV